MTALALGPVRISEADQESLCDDLVQQHGGHITRQSQRRASKVSEGISDRVYHVFDQRITFEVKAEDSGFRASSRRAGDYPRGERGQP